MKHCFEANYLGLQEVWLGGREAGNGPNTSWVGCGLHAMNLQLDLCQSIQLGSDPVESPGVVQAWKHRMFKEVVWE
jgi:hypothetical protein